MRHQKRTSKLGRKTEHREAMLANMVCSLIKHNRITTTLAKAKALRPFAEKVVTMGKKGDIHNRRLATSKIKQDEAVKKLFAELAPRFKDREGGYTRILKLGSRAGDAAPMALIEWVEETVEKKPAKKATAKKEATAPVKEKKEAKEAPAEKAAKEADQAPAEEKAEAAAPAAESEEKKEEKAE